jgi:hypothetical protein
MTTETLSISTVDREHSLVASGFGPAGPTVAPQLVPSPINIVRSSRIPPDDTDGRWVNGFAYMPEGSGDLKTSDYCSAKATPPISKANGTVDWTPYLLSASFKCSTFGFQAADYQGRATRLLEAATPKLLELEFWGGALATLAGLNNTFLAKAGGPVAKAATSMAQAFGQLEQGLADCGYGGRGTIHMPPYALAYCGTFLRREGNLLLTQRDTIVVPGSGYPGPAAAAFDMYATGITDVRLTDIYTVPDSGDVGGAINKTDNSIVVTAERMGIVSWDELCWIKTTVTLP